MIYFPGYKYFKHLYEIDLQILLKPTTVFYL